MEIRLLTGEDALAFQTLRLKALCDRPEAFGMSYEEEKDRTVDQIAKQLTEGPPDAFYFGAWADNTDDTLCGMLGMFRNPRIKTRHKASLGLMYVDPSVRGQGVGLALVQHVIDYARTIDGLEDLILAVTVGNDSARKLYLKSGFVPYGVEPRYIHIEDRYYDIEWMHLRIS